MSGIRPSNLRSGWKTAVYTTALAAVTWSCGHSSSHTDDSAIVSVAAAGNFAAPQTELARLFHSMSGVKVETSLGATGQLYAQIVNGAPYDLFLAADTLRPKLLEDGEFTIPGARFTYAIGRLALYAPSWDSIRSVVEELRSRDIRHLAIANPHTAPYGVAAVEVLRRWELEDVFETRIVRGETVGQAFQFVESGAADAGLISLSQVVRHPTRTYSIVSEDLHHPLHQDAVLLRRAAFNPHAHAYLEFLQSDEGKRVITGYGYRIPGEGR